MVDSLGGGDYPLLVIVGPTAAGKSALALALAQQLNGEIVSCDSVQVYRGFDIGAGKVPPPDRRGIPHHLLDLVRPDEVFTAGDYRREAWRVINEVRERGKLPIIVGGTGFYLRALLLGLFEGAPRSNALRARLKGLAERRGRETLHRLLKRLDPETARRIHSRDTQKVIRAIEICLVARQPMSALLARGRSGLRGFRVLKIGLNPERSQLGDRINIRVKHMFAHGLLKEARAALEKYAGRDNLYPLGALGYRQACAVLRGQLSTEEAIRLTQNATRQYAKRQMTWFRGETNITWFNGFGDEAELQRKIFEWLRQVWPRATRASLSTAHLDCSPRPSNAEEL